jgi:hypothetical protein
LSAVRHSRQRRATPSLAWARYQNVDDERLLNITSCLALRRPV